MDKKHVRLVIKMIVMSIILYSLFIFIGNYKEIKHTALSFSLPIFLLSIAMTYIGYAIRFLKWDYLLRSVAIKLPIKENIHIFFIGISMSITPGKIGEFLKSFAISKHSNIPIVKTAPVIFIDRLSDLFSLLLLIAIGSIFMSFPLFYFVLLVIGMITLMLLLKKQTWCHAIINFVCKLKKVSNKKESLFIFYDGIYQMLLLKTFAISTLLSVLAWFVQSLTLYYLLVGLGIHFSVLTVCFIFSVGLLLSSLSMLPNGLGLTEASIVGMLVYYNVTLSQSISLALINSVISLWIGVFIGICILWIKRKSYF